MPILFQLRYRKLLSPSSRSAIISTTSLSCHSQYSLSTSFTTIVNKPSFNNNTTFIYINDHHHRHFHYYTSHRFFSTTLLHCKNIIKQPTITTLLHPCSSPSLSSLTPSTTTTTTIASHTHQPFSSSSSSSSLSSTHKKKLTHNNKLDGTRLLRTTQYILSSPPGSLTPTLINESTRCMEYWSLQRHEPRNAIIAQSLLDRIIAEEEALLMTRTKGGGGTASGSDSIKPTKNANTRRRYRHQSFSPHHHLVTADMYSAVISAHSTSQTSPSPHRAQKLLCTMISKGYQPSNVILTTVVNAWSKAGRATKAQNLLLSSLAKNPNELTYGAVMDAWATKGNVDEILALMKDMKERHGVEPNVYCYNALIKGYINSNNVEKAEEILFLQNNKNNKNKNTDEYSYASVIDGWAQRGNAHRAEKILHHMMEHDDNDDDDDSCNSVKPNTVIYNAVIKAWSRCHTNNNNNNGVGRESRRKQRRNAAIRAEALLKKMTEEYRRGNGRVMPDTMSFNTVLATVARCGSWDDGAGKKAEMILKEMEGLYEGGMMTIRPDSFSYNAVIYAYAQQCGTNNGGGGGGGMRRRGLMDNTNDKNNNNNNAAESCAKILQQMSHRYTTSQWHWAKPDLVSYNTVIGAYAKQGDADKAEQTLRDMEQRCHSSSSSKDDDAVVVVDVQPDIISYNTVIDAFAKGGRPEKAEELLLAMECGLLPSSSSSSSPQQQQQPQRRRRSRNDKKDSSPQPPPPSSSLPKPDTVSYSTVMDAWARSGHPQSGQKAESILKRMEDAYNAGYQHLRPNVITMNTVINAHAKSKSTTTTTTTTTNNDTTAESSSSSAKRAEAILQRSILKKIKNLPHSFLPPPDMISFCSVINAYAHSTAHDKALRARHVLKEMIEFYSSSGEEGSMDRETLRNAYHMVINACTFTGGESEDKRMAMYVAIDVLNEMRQPLVVATTTTTTTTTSKTTSSLPPTPTSQTYAALLQTCARLLDVGEERDRLADGLFAKCLEDGCVDDDVNFRFRQAASEGWRRRRGGGGGGREMMGGCGGDGDVVAGEAGGDKPIVSTTTTAAATANRRGVVSRTRHVRINKQKVDGVER